MEIKKIETYSLYEFCQTVQQSIIDGWRFDFESNENFPTSFGSMLVAGLVKVQPKVVTAKEVTEANTETVTADNNQVKRSRKPKE
jgi:hypothetical protein